MNENNSNDLQTIITQVIEEMKSEQGDKFDINRINLAEMERRTGMTRAQLRRLKKNDFQITPHALTGRKADTYESPNRIGRLQINVIPADLPGIDTSYHRFNLAPP